MSVSQYPPNVHFMFYTVPATIIKKLSFSWFVPFSLCNTAAAGVCEEAKGTVVAIYHNCTVIP